VKWTQVAVGFQGGVKFHVCIPIPISVYIKLDKMSALTFAGACFSFHVSHEDRREKARCNELLPLLLNNNFTDLFLFCYRFYANVECALLESKRRFHQWPLALWNKIPCLYLRLSICTFTYNPTLLRDVSDGASDTQNEFYSIDGYNDGYYTFTV